MRLEAGDRPLWPAVASPSSPGSGEFRLSEQRLPPEPPRLWGCVWGCGWGSNTAGPGARGRRGHPVPNDEDFQNDDNRALSQAPTLLSTGPAMGPAPPMASPPSCLCEPLGGHRPPATVLATLGRELTNGPKGPESAHSLVQCVMISSHMTGEKTEAQRDRLPAGPPEDIQEVA